MSSEPGVGRLLATLAASVRHGGRVLEIGTGVGVGTAWIVHGLRNRVDVEVITIEQDPRYAQAAMRAGWPNYVRVVFADAVTVIRDLGQFELVFADAQGGKWFGLDLSIGAVAPGGHLLVDDMRPSMWTVPDQEAKTAEVRRTLLEHADLTCVELDSASGMILASKQLPEATGK